MYGLLGLVILGFSGAIIALAGFAGWSTGQRIGQTNATATQSAVINEQLNRIPIDVRDGNQVLLQARLQYLLTLTPAVAGLDSIIQTATAVYENSLPTPTPPPTATPQAPPATATPQPIIQTGDATPDLTALLAQAQSAITIQDWDTAIDTLDAVMSFDPTFQSGAVRTLMLEALTRKALPLFRSPDSSGLAEAIQLTDLARQYGDVGELNYESLIAGLYLDALNATGIDYNRSIAKLAEVYQQAPGYRDVLSRLVNEYVTYGDALIAQGQPCSATSQYQNALNYQDNVMVVGKRDAAQTSCQLQATQALIGTVMPGTIQPVGVAPVGEPGG